MHYNDKEKLVIIGAGISGIFLGKKYKDKYDVTIFEQSDKIGGKIQTYNNISTSVQGLFSDPPINEPLYNALFKNSSKISITLNNFDIFTTKLNIFIMTGVAYLLIRKVKNNTQKLVIIIILIIFYIKTIMFGIFQYMKCLGAVPTYEEFIKIISSTVILNNIKLSIASVMTGDTGYNGYLDDTFVKYIVQMAKGINIQTNSKVVYLNKENKYLTIRDNTQYERNIYYDKLVICHNILYSDYIDVKTIVPQLPLSDFYSIIIKKTNNPRDFPDYIDGYTIESNHYIIASHIKPKDNDFIDIVKIAEWKMPHIFLNEEQCISLSNYLKQYEIYSTGEHLCQGVPHCIDQADKVIL